MVVGFRKSLTRWEVLGILRVVEDERFERLKADPDLSKRVDADYKMRAHQDPPFSGNGILSSTDREYLKRSGLYNPSREVLDYVASLDSDN